MQNGRPGNRQHGCSQMDFLNIYNHKKVLLTGHTGFKGSWLMVWLQLIGADVKGYSLPPFEEHKLYNDLDGDKLCKSQYDDILNYAEFEKAILDFQPDFIFHLAAQAIVRTSYREPVETFSINAIGTANLLNALRKLDKVCQVVLITTDKVYHNNEWSYAYRENDRLGGYDPYSASKACAELIIDSFRNSYFNIKEYQSHKKSIAVARAGNVIGGGDWAKDRIVPDIINALQKKESIPVRNPMAVRPWQHVTEPLYGYLLLGSKLVEEPIKYSAAYNFGPWTNDSFEVQQMVATAIETWGSGAWHFVKEEKKLHEAGLLKLDISKVVKELSWQPVFNAGEAIKKTISWYKNFNGINAYELIKNDILSFEQALTKNK